MSEESAEGYFIFSRVSQTSSADGSGYIELRYLGHTYGKAPEDYLHWSAARENQSGRELLFFKISDAIRLTPEYRTIPAKTEITNVKGNPEPITDLRWMQ